MNFNFIPIDIPSYANLYIEHNPTHDKDELIKSLVNTLEDFKNGARCACGNPIWVAASAIYEYACFTCITGETDASEDFEIDEACY